MNYEGLRRRGFSAERLAAVKAMHRALYRQELTLAQARQAILELKKSNPQAEQDIDAMLGFLDQTSSQRGIVR